MSTLPSNASRSTGSSQGPSSAEERLFSACAAGCVEEVAQALTAGANIEQRGLVGQTRLGIASKRGHASVVELLLRKGAKPSACNEDQESPLFLALQARRCDVATMLMAAGANIKCSDKYSVYMLGVMARFPDILHALLRNFIPLTEEDKFLVLNYAVLNNHLTLLKALLMRVADFNNKGHYAQIALDVARLGGSQQDTIDLIEKCSSVEGLRRAVEAEDTECVRITLKSGIGLDDDIEEEEPLICIAAAKNQRLIVEALLHYKAQYESFKTGNFTHFMNPKDVLDDESSLVVVRKYIDAKCMTSDGEDNALHIACREGHLDIADLLVTYNADVNTVNKYTHSPLLLAAMNNRYDTVKLLLSHGVDVARAGVCPALFGAAYGGYTDIIQLLIDRGASVNTPDEYGNTPLYFAASEGHVEVVETLLDCGADVNKANKNKEGALYLAAKNGRYDTVKLLLSHGADIAGGGGYPPLCGAAAGGNTDIIQLLIDRGASVNTEYGVGWTPLYHAAREGHVEAVRILFDLGATQTGDWGFIPLHEVAAMGHTDVARVLLERGTDINAKNMLGDTPLHEAVTSNEAEIVSLLLEKGAAVNVTNNSGRTALFYARFKSHAIVEMLLNHGAIEL